MIYDDYEMHSVVEIRALALRAAERRKKVLLAIRFSDLPQAISFNPDAMIDISFLDMFDDHYVSDLIDVAVNLEPGASYQEDEFNPFDDIAKAENPMGTGQNLLLKHVRVMEALIERHGVIAIYKALEAAGRITFRDKRFGADLGL